VGFHIWHQLSQLLQLLPHQHLSMLLGSTPAAAATAAAASRTTGVRHEPAANAGALRSRS
jgi:hypothetical protein